MGSWTIYSKDRTPKYTVKELEYHDTWMGEEYVTVSITSPTPLELAIGDYLVYRGLTYSVYSVPGALKQARKNTYGEAFKYDNVKLSSRGTELTDIRFLDYVLDDNNIHYTSLPTFAFYAETVDDLLDRLQANTDREGVQWLFISPSYNRTMQRYEQGTPAYQEAAQLWEQYFGGSHEDPVYEKTNVNISIDKQSVWDGLAPIKNDFGLNFFSRERAVIVGGEGMPAEHVFQYGKGNGLYQIERVADQDQKVTTKLYAYGSDKNLPIRYYANITRICFAYLYARPSVDSNILYLDFVWNRSYVTGTADSDGKFPVVVSIAGVTYNVKAYPMDVGARTLFTIEASVSLGFVTRSMEIDFVSGIDKDKFPASNVRQESGALPNNMAVQVLMLPGFPQNSLADLCRCTYNGEQTVLEIRKTPSESYNEFMRIEGNHPVTFSNDPLQPYILSGNAGTLGIKEGDVHFVEDNDDNGLKEIYPSIEGMTRGDVEGTSSTERLDEIVSCDVIQDNGVFGEGVKIENFNLVLKDIGFDLKEAFDNAGGNMTLSMKDGYCGGRDFSVHSVTSIANGQWRLNVERSHDEGLDLWFPYSTNATIGQTPTADEPYQIRTGDHFVLTEIEIGDTSYIWAAAMKMLRKSITYLLNNDYTRFTYLPKVDDIYMARQHDESQTQAGIESLHDTLKSGMLMLFEDEDLDVDGSVFIDSLTIKENGNNGIPTYDVVLRNDKQVGTMQRIQNQINSLTSYIGGGGGGLSVSQIRSLINSYGGELFLSKVNADIAAGRITFLQGLEALVLSVFNGIRNNGRITSDEADIPLFVSDTTIDGILHVLAKIVANQIESDNFNGDGPFDTGFELTKNDGTGYSYLVVDKLYVRLKAIFNELEIRKISYAGGNYIFSHAGSTIIAVKPTSGAWRCYMKADDGTTSTENWWHVNDQARCQEFGVQEPGVYQDFETRYYWRKVVAVGHENIALEEGQEPGEYNYVDLSVTDCESGSDEPKAGDRIVQMGNRTDLDRQGFISLEVDGEYAPAFKVYKNVNLYDLNNKRKICLSPKYTELRLQKLVIETEYDAKPVKIFRGAWSNITNHRCYYYDEVTHNDETWYCTFPESGIGGVKYTTEEPSDNAQYWVKEVAKGKDGKDGNSFNILGSYNTMAELIAEHPTGNVGNAYIVGSDLVVWDAENNRWKDVGQFKGDTGRGIASVVISYGKSSSSTVLPTTWVSSVSDLELKAGDYLFTRTIYRYDTGTPATSDPVYTIGYIGKDGKDGEGLPAAVLNLSDSVVEIETDENGAATKAFREEITYDMKASGKILYVKNISVPSASHVSVPSYYLSPLKQNAITVSGKVATMMGTVSGTVLTLSQKPDITRLPHIIVSANAGATISEGNVTLNGTAVDKDGKTYEAMNIFVIGRQYYAPALQVVLSQDTVILTQDENTKLIDLTGAYTNVSMRIGGTDITEGLAITVAAEHCNASVIANTVKIDAILTEEGVYYDRGYVDITISYNGKSYLKRWPFYCNLLGTWKESVENDTKEAIAQSTWWDLDESGNIVESERLGNFVQSSKENTARLEELNYVAVYTGTEKSFTLTAEQITKYGKNYRLVMDYACSSERVTITVKKGSTVIATFTNVLSYDTFDEELTNLSAGTYTITFSQTVTVGRIDVFAVSTNKFSEISQTVDKISLSVESKENVNLVPDPDIYQMLTTFVERTVALVKDRKYTLTARLKNNSTSSRTCGIEVLTVTTLGCALNAGETKDFYKTFTAPADGDFTIRVPQTASVQLQWLQLEQGDSSTKHNTISSAFKRTGIDIENGTINLQADKVAFYDSSGSVSPYIELTSDGKIKATEVDLSGKISATSGDIGGFIIGTSNIHSAAEDSSHNPLIQLNNDGSARIGGLVVANNGDATLTGTINATGGNISGNLVIGEIAAHRYHFEFKPKEAAGGTGSYSYYSAQLIGYSDNSATSKEEVFSIKMGQLTGIDDTHAGYEPVIKLLDSSINPYRFYFQRTINNKVNSISNILYNSESSLQMFAWRGNQFAHMTIGVIDGKCNIVVTDSETTNIGWITDSQQTPKGGVYVTEMLGRMVMCVRT